MTVKKVIAELEKSNIKRIIEDAQELGFTEIDRVALALETALNEFEQALTEHM